MLGFGLLRVILALFGNPTKMGYLALAPGLQVIEVKTGWTPSRVWIDLGPVSNLPCCGSGEDTFDITIVKHGFILTANIKSNCRQVRWFAIK